mmetsp:Transcript_9245/g.21478  ORF Transcript_9245/g.21478 Transcript_9245/m.21478 type:complete len:211 (-) Transcript_9245:193-825(-)
MQLAALLAAYRPSCSPWCSGRPIFARGTSQNFFGTTVDLGDGSGFVDCELPALFTRSVLLTVRYQLPFSLEAAPMQGVLKVTTPGNGLQVGDVLRACSTLELRYDSARQRMCYGAGIRGQPPPSEQVASTESSWMGRMRIEYSWISELGGFRQTRPTKVLFLTDGKPHQVVNDALIANTIDRGVESIVMLFERPNLVGSTVDTCGGLYVT